MSKVTLDTIQCEISQVEALLEVICDTVSGMDFGHGETRNHELDRVNALAEIAFRLTRMTNEKIDKSFSQVGRLS
ncbi:hypothetical protein [Martelella sp. FOR1707]